MNKQTGFTLVELLISLAVIAVLVNSGRFAYQAMLAGGERDAAATSLSTALNFARSEAIKRSGVISVCPASSAGDACAQAFSDEEASAGWAESWLVFVNEDADFPPALDAGETILRRYSDRALHFESSAEDSILRGVNLLAHGVPQGSGSVRFCDTEQTRASALVTLSPLGLATLTYDADTRGCGG